MGYARWDPSAWSDYTRTTRGRSRDELFTSREMRDHLNPRLVGRRESRDSDLNPRSTPIIVAVDVTGSMGVLAETLVRHGLKPLFEEILARRPVSDPHVMAMAVGDAWYDRAPLQVTQFEADIRVAEQLQGIWIEGGGGGNRYESYNLPWYFAATQTSVDSWERRNEKGYLFTVGDEPCPPVLLSQHIERVFGVGNRPDLTSAEVLAMAERSWEVFHLMVEEGSYHRHDPDGVRRSWREVLGQRALPLSDHTRLAEVIVSAIEVTEGLDRAAAVDSWSGDTSRVVADALRDLPALRPPTGRPGRNDGREDDDRGSDDPRDRR